MTIDGGASWAKPLDKDSDMDPLTELSPRPYELSQGLLSFAFDRGQAEAQESSRNSPGVHSSKRQDPDLCGSGRGL